MTSIVQVNVSQQVAPTPPTLQRAGALVSQGGTILSKLGRALITQPSDLTPLLTGPRAISALAFLTGVVTATTSQPHGLTVGQKVHLDIAGAAPAAYNGSYIVTVTSSTQFTYEKAANPGSATVTGSFTPRSVSELQQMVTTFFAQGNQQAIYVLELGAGSVTEGVAALTDYLTKFPNANYAAGAEGYFYGYLIPRTWDADPDFLALAALYQSTTARTYFWVTTTLQNYPAYTALQKAVFALVEAPAIGVWKGGSISSSSWATGKQTLNVTAHGIQIGQWFQIVGATPAANNGWRKAVEGTTTNVIVCEVASDPGAMTVLGSIAPNYFASAGLPSTEFSLAAVLWVTLNYDPSDTNKPPPLAFSYVFGVTPFPVQGMGPVLTALKTAYVNVIGTGAEGGISNAIVLWGRLKDGNPFNFWYATDWVAIEGDIALANAVINGSNNPINPLYYNQNGVDRLQAVLASVVQRAVTFGLVLFPPKQTALTGPELTAALATDQFDGSSVVNAVPFIRYSQNNPSHYRQGLYEGFSATFTPLRGFEQIQINLVVSSFVVQ